MAVYTQVPENTLRAFLEQYRLGDLQSFSGIEQGVENTNYHLFTTTGRYILTLFEKRVNPVDLPFFFAYTDHLSKAGIVCPAAIADRKGANINELCGRPAAVISFLEGRGVEPCEISARHCLELGEATARMHLASQDFPLVRKNNVGLAAWKDLAAKTEDLADSVEPGLAGFISDELFYLEANWPSDLPETAVHLDAFPDNVFFKDGRFAGMIDFYFTATDFLAYDLALIVNAWCFRENNDCMPERYESLLSGYEKLRPLSPEEKEVMPVLYRGAAMRILMTRLHDWVFHPPGALVKPKDPLEYVAKLRFHQHGGLECAMKPEPA